MLGVLDDYGIKFVRKTLNQYKRFGINMATKDAAIQKAEITNKTCGIIMPITPHPDYPSDHWKDVLNILIESVKETEFEPKLVSDDVAIGLIHDRIVTNIYNNEMVICDVSSKNPNVMFELGLRLAFDKPTIIIKDESTGYSFDTGVIEHIPYPSSLRFSQIVKFKEELIRRINATYEKSKTETNYSPFLKSFGKNIFPVLIQQSNITEGEYIRSQLEKINRKVNSIILNHNTINDSASMNINNITLRDKKKILDYTLNKYLKKYFYSDIYNDLKLQVNILDELANNGVEISINELVSNLQYREQS